MRGRPVFRAHDASKLDASAGEDADGKLLAPAVAAGSSGSEVGIDAAVLFWGIGLQLCALPTRPMFLPQMGHMFGMTEF